MFILGYTKWGNFSKVIAKAKISCSNSNNNLTDHFADISKMVSIGSGAHRKQETYKLSRYARYLIVQNADSRKNQLL